MHTSGKVAAWLIVVGALAAIWLSSKALGVRNAWMQVAQKNEDDYRKNEAEISEKSRDLDSERIRLAHDMLGWDRYWPEVAAAIDQAGNLNLGLGTANGVEPDQSLFVFAIDAEGGSKFLGNFKVVGADGNRSRARPNWRVRAGELAPTSGVIPVRVRTMVPNQYQARQAALDQQLLAVEQRIATETEQIDMQKQLDDLTGVQVGLRLGEINGSKSLEGRRLPDPLIRGYLVAIPTEEEARNKALLEADRLLRQLKETRRQFEETLRENRRLTESLPQGSAATPTVGAVGR
ncbi:MAG: hypothetical protein ACT4QC_05695 [Planctomycetaceae bacterium]